jgi:hypothetical protein
VNLYQQMRLRGFHSATPAAAAAAAALPRSTRVDQLHLGDAPDQLHRALHAPRLNIIIICINIKLCGLLASTTASTSSCCTLLCTPSAAGVTAAAFALHFFGKLGC